MKKVVGKGTSGFKPTYQSFLVTGPPSSGKTHSFQRYIKATGCPYIWLDFRDVPVDTVEKIESALLVELKAVQSWSEKVTAEGAINLVDAGIQLLPDAATKAMLGTLMPVLKEVAAMWTTILDDSGATSHQKMARMIGEFATASKNQATPLPFIVGFDEINAMKPLLNADGTYLREEEISKAVLFDNLQAMITKLTKQDELATVVQLTSDQQFAQQYGPILEKRFAKTYSFGYMSEADTLTYINKSGITDTEVARAIFDTCGGHFTDLKDAINEYLRNTQPVQAVLQPMRDVNARNLVGRIKHLTDDDRTKFVKLASAAFQEKPFIDFNKFEKDLGKDLAEQVIRLNLVHVRNTAEPGLCTDLTTFTTPTNAQGVTLSTPVAGPLPKKVVTPFTPIDHWAWRNRDVLMREGLDF